MHACNKDADCGAAFYCCYIDVKGSGVSRQCELACPKEKRASGSDQWAGIRQS